MPRMAREKSNTGHIIMTDLIQLQQATVRCIPLPMTH